MSLPVELTRMVYEYLDDEELAKTCMLNKNFSEKVCNSEFWIKKIMDRYGLTPEEIRKFKGNNTSWAYYKHLSEIYHTRPVFGPKYIERIYNHPEFKRVTKDMFVYSRDPKWLDKAGFEEDFLYRLIDFIIDNYAVEEYFDDYRTGDIATYSGFLIPQQIFIPPRLRDYILQQMVEAFPEYKINRRNFTREV